MNYYILNNETGKIQLHFDYSDYQKLSPESKAEIKSAFLWSRFAGAWVSRAKHPNTYYAENIAKKLNLEYKGEEGEKLSFEEQKQIEQEKAQNRAERFEQRAERAENESKAQFNLSQKLADVIPMGQPILVGHHSERGHRRHIEKIDNAMRKSCEADEKANYYNRRAEASINTAEGKKYSDPVYLDNRIKECEASIRVLERRLQGKYYVHSTPEPISEEAKKHYEARLSEETDKLNFFKEKQAQLGIIVEPASLKKEYEQKRVTHVKRRKIWYPVKSFNAKSITVLNWLDIAEWTWSVKYSEVQGTKTLEDLHIVMDRDGNEVKPQVKY